MADEDLDKINTQEPTSNQEAGENSGATGEPSSSQNKVELDLDDAPFLEEEPEPKPEPKPEETSSPLEIETPQEGQKLTRLQKLLKRKKLLIGIGLGLILLIVGLVFLLSGGEEVVPEPEIAPPVVEEIKELPPIEAKPGEVLIDWEEFWVEYSDQDGETRFLVCKLSAPTINPDLKLEADIKVLAIRDAIYYYLSHKPLIFLSEQDNAETLKADLLGIVNGYLTRGTLTQIYIESYLIR